MHGQKNIKIIEDTVPGGTEVNTRIMLTWHF